MKKLKISLFILVAAFLFLYLYGCSNEDMIDKRREQPVESTQSDDSEYAPVESSSGEVASAEAAPEELEEMGDASSAPVESHVWKSLYGIDAFLHGYQVYTYVLASRFDAKGKERIEVLVNAITQSTGEAGIHDRRETANMFLIPMDTMDEIYSFGLSQTLIAELKKGLDQQMKEKLNGKGPFLISVTSNIGFGPLPNRVLVADLSKTNKALMKDVIRTYKQQLESDSHTITFKSLRLAVANFLVNANENLKLFKSEAGELKEIIG